MPAEAADSFLSGNVEVGKAMLRDYINATIGFEAPSQQVHIKLKRKGVFVWLLRDYPFPLKVYPPVVWRAILNNHENTPVR